MQRVDRNRELITQAEFARRLGVNRSSVRCAVLAGRIRLHDGLVDEAEARRDWYANTAPSPRSVLNREPAE